MKQITGEEAKARAEAERIAQAERERIDPDERDRAYIKARAEAVGGMTLRDHFATYCGKLGDEVSMDLAAELAATQGVEKPSDSKDQMGWHRFWCAVHAAHRYMMADAMLAARKEKS